MCWVMTVGGQFAGNFCSTAISASTPPVDEPIATILRPTRKSATDTGGTGDSGGCTNWRCVRAAALTFSARSPKGRGSPGAGFPDAIEGPDLERGERRLRAAMRHGGDHDDRHGAKPHDLLEKFQAVHIRHLDVERDDIGIELFDRLARFQRIARLADDVDVRVGTQDGADQSAHRREVMTATRTLAGALIPFSQSFCGVAIGGNADIVEDMLCFAGNALGVADVEDIAAFRQQFGKARPDLHLRRFVEIDHDVSAEDDVELALEGPLRHQVQLVVGDQALDTVIDLEFAAHTTLTSSLNHCLRMAGDTVSSAVSS